MLTLFTLVSVTSAMLPTPHFPGTCPWQAHTGVDYVFKCANGQYCDALTLGYDCCATLGGRVQCPSNMPFMCASRMCGNNDYCCAISSCNDYGGPRPCTSGAGFGAIGGMGMPSFDDMFGGDDFFPSGMPSGGPMMASLDQWNKGNQKEDNFSFGRPDGSWGTGRSNDADWNQGFSKKFQSGGGVSGRHDQWNQGNMNQDQWKFGNPNGHFGSGSTQKGEWNTGFNKNLNTPWGTNSHAKRSTGNVQNDQFSIGGPGWSHQGKSHNSEYADGEQKTVRNPDGSWMTTSTTSSGHNHSSSKRWTSMGSMETPELPAEAPRHAQVGGMNTSGRGGDLGGMGMPSFDDMFGGDNFFSSGMPSGGPMMASHDQWNKGNQKEDAWSFGGPGGSFGEGSSKSSNWDTGFSKKITSGGGSFGSHDQWNKGSTNQDQWKFGKSGGSWGEGSSKSKEWDTGFSKNFGFNGDSFGSHDQWNKGSMNQDQWKFGKSNGSWGEGSSKSKDWNTGFSKNFGSGSTGTFGRHDEWNRGTMNADQWKFGNPGGSIGSGSTETRDWDTGFSKSSRTGNGMKSHVRRSTGNEKNDNFSIGGPGWSHQGKSHNSEFADGEQKTVRNPDGSWMTTTSTSSGSSHSSSQQWTSGGRRRLPHRAKNGAKGTSVPEETARD